MPEWLKGMDCKSISFTYAGSNPARPKIFHLSIVNCLKFLLIYHMGAKLNNLLCLF